MKSCNDDDDNFNDKSYGDNGDVEDNDDDDGDDNDQDISGNPDLPTTLHTINLYILQSVAAV